MSPVVLSDGVDRVSLTVVSADVDRVSPAVLSDGVDPSFLRYISPYCSCNVLGIKKA